MKRKKLKIGVDVRPLASSKTGIGHYVYNVLEELAEIDPYNEYFLYSHLPVKGNLPDFYRHVCFSQTKKSHYWLQTQLPFRLFKDKIDLFWGGGYAAPMVGPAIHRWKTVITVHDLVYQRYPETLPWKPGIHMRWCLPSYMRVADRIIADSENTARDIETFHGRLRNKVTVIPLAASKRFFEERNDDAVQRVLSQYGLKPGYLLYVGTIEPRKGVDTILRALAQLQDRGVATPQLVLAGKAGWKTEGIMALPQSLGLQGLVHFLDYVADDDLPAIYKGATLFLYPSLYEGFGLPVLEAMASGTPVITSRAASLPEVAGDAAVYVDAGDVAGLGRMIEECLSNVVLRERLKKTGRIQAEKFSWRKTAERTLELFEECGVID